MNWETTLLTDHAIALTASIAPQIVASIGFFDGFDTRLVAFSYFYIVLFSIVFQVVKHYCSKN